MTRDQEAMAVARGYLKKLLARGALDESDRGTVRATVEVLDPRSNPKLAGPDPLLVDTLGMLESMEAFFDGAKFTWFRHLLPRVKDALQDNTTEGFMARLGVEPIDPPGREYGDDDDE